jgi:hypothetical protein
VVPRLLPGLVANPEGIPQEGARQTGVSEMAEGGGEKASEAAQAAASISLREPRPVGFPFFFTGSMEIVEPVVAFLHEHAIQRAHTADTIRTYAEILFDWFDTLEQSSIAWDNAPVPPASVKERQVVLTVAHAWRAFRVFRLCVRRSADWSPSAIAEDRQGARPAVSRIRKTSTRAAARS